MPQATVSKKTSTNKSKAKTTRNWIIGSILVVLFILISTAVSYWIDILWFEDIGFIEMFWTPIKAQATIFSLVFAASTLLIYLSVFVAIKLSPGWKNLNNSDQSEAWIEEDEEDPFTPFEGFRQEPQKPRDVFNSFAKSQGLKTGIEEMGAAFSPIIYRVMSIATIIAGFFIGISASNRWLEYKLALNGGSFGVNDPQFGLDVGFYIFKLPAIRAGFEALNSTLFYAIALTAMAYLFLGAIKPWRKQGRFLVASKAHFSVLFAIFMIFQAFRNVLSIIAKVYSDTGTTMGAGYTDVHIGIPALWALVGLSLVIAVLFIVNIFIKGWKLPAYGFGAYIAAYVLLGIAGPFLVQMVLVNPNEASYEAPYISRNIDMTRRAFDLEDVEGKVFPATDNLSPDVVEKNPDTFNNVRLWNPAVAGKSFEQLQGIRPYYTFMDLDVDRYPINGQKRQVLMATREIDISRLAQQAKTWVNTHLVYTHGFGSVINETSVYDNRGLPKFTVGDIPPRIDPTLAPNSPKLEIKEPRVYYGEANYDYAVVNTGIDEFDHPEGNQNATTRYSADTGIEVGGFPRRAAWALKLNSTQMLFSGYINKDSKVLINRNITNRVSQVAPWLELDKDPYSTIVDGRILWVIDGYTTSRMYPYAERDEVLGLNYIRNSVKVTIDAYTGEMKFYAFDSEEPILKAYEKIFPGLFTPATEMPQDLWEHLRYPETLFSLQSDIFRIYHMTDPLVFYNKEDQWDIPKDDNGEQMTPFFVLLQLPGTDEEHFYMITPYTPRNRDNMIGYMAVSSDPENYGARTVYQFPKDRVVLGPDQIKARINQDPVISPQFSLWNQRGSQVIFGDMIILPVYDSIVYVQSVFLQAEKAAIPELTAVVVAYGDKLVMHRDFKTALKEVFGAAEGGPGMGGEEDIDSIDTTPSVPGLASLDEAMRLYDEALKAQKDGDWARYGRLINELGKMLEELSGK